MDGSIAALVPGIAIAALIGLATGWWIWGVGDRPAASAPAPILPRAPAPSPFLAAPQGEPDDLTRLKGVGPKLGDLLYRLGVFHFRQIAAWTPDQAEAADAELGRFRGRIARDRWVEQARLLAVGDDEGFDREFGS